MPPFDNATATILSGIGAECIEELAKAPITPIFAVEEFDYFQNEFITRIVQIADSSQHRPHKPVFLFPESDSQHHSMHLTSIPFLEASSIVVGKHPDSIAGNKR